ncbi:MAG: VWA domain-containing protein [Acidobacteriota bacterium]|nr:VWA domain-containing protein [Acidobacteriota bacterium]MDH3524473.1 VWA domain-containing protein [Acidobacteriota bacterium]
MNQHLIVGAAALLAIAGLAAAQEPGPAALAESAESEGAFFETVDVNLVNVEVYVTDKQGRAITGLTRDDFVILEDGRPVEITNFFTVEGGMPVLPPPPAAVAAPALPVGGALPETVQPLAVPEDQRLYLVVYVDNFNIRPFNRNRVFRRLREFLTEQLGAEDRVMLVSYDRSLHYRHPFTSSPDLVARALFELEDLSGHAIHADSERRDILREIAEAEALGEVEYRVRTYAESMYNDLSFSIDAMDEIVTSLAGLPGRKALLYVSDGLPATAADDMFQALSRSFNTTTVLSTAQEFNANRLFERLAAKANANRVTFYTVDAAGLRAPGGSSVELATAAEAGLATFVDSVYISNLQAPLLRLAEATGGQAIINTNDVGERLAQVATDFNTYYSLGYPSAHSGDGRYYKLEVRLAEKLKGARVRHREGYRDKPITDRMSDGALATLVYGFEDNPLDLAIRVEASQPDEEGGSRYYLVDIVVDIPLNRIELVPIGDFHVGQTRVYFVAMDSEGDTSDVSEVPLALRIPNAQVAAALQQLYPYRVTLRMRQGPHRLAVGVVDEIGANRSFLSRSFVVGG